MLKFIITQTHPELWENNFYIFEELEDSITEEVAKEYFRVTYMSENKEEDPYFLVKVEKKNIAEDICHETITEYIQETWDENTVHSTYSLIESKIKELKEEIRKKDIYIYQPYPTERASVVMSWGEFE